MFEKVKAGQRVEEMAIKDRKAKQDGEDGGEEEEEEEEEGKEEEEEEEEEGMEESVETRYPNLLSRCGVIPARVEQKLAGMLRAYFRALSSKLIVFHKKAFKLKRKVEEDDFVPGKEGGKDGSTREKRQAALMVAQRDADAVLQVKFWIIRDGLSMVGNVMKRRRKEKEEEKREEDEEGDRRSERRRK